LSVFINSSRAINDLKGEFGIPDKDKFAETLLSFLSYEEIFSLRKTCRAMKQRLQETSNH